MHEPPASLPSLPRRLLGVLFFPGEIFRALGARPAWFGALAVSAALTLLSLILVPGEVFEESIRQQLVSAGQRVPDNLDFAAGIARWFAVVFGGLSVAIWAVILATGTTVVFGFVLGDDGRWSQYFAITTHAVFVTAIGALVTLPLRIMQGDLTVTLNLGSLAPFLDDGYLATLLRFLDLFQLWSVVLIALGVSLVDEDRSWGSAATVMLTLLVVVAGIIALVVPLPS